MNICGQFEKKIKVLLHRVILIDRQEHQNKITNLDKKEGIQVKAKYFVYLELYAQAVND